MSKDYSVICQYFGEGEYEDRTACVVKQIGEKDVYGIKVFLGEQQVGLEWFEGKAQYYAEDAAENYILGIKGVVGKILDL